MKARELDQMSKKHYTSNEKFVVKYDIAEVGYQQFDLIDDYRIYKDPYGTNTDEGDADNYKKLEYNNAQAQFLPEKIQSSDHKNLYISMFNHCRFVYIRDFKDHTVIKAIPTTFEPTCMKIMDYSALEFEKDYDQHTGGKKKDSKSVLIVNGTTTGQVYVTKFSFTTDKGSNKHYQVAKSDENVSFGEVTQVDVNKNGKVCVASTQSGEIIEFDLITKVADHYRRINERGVGFAGAEDDSGDDK